MSRLASFCAIVLFASWFGVEGSRYDWKGSLRKHGVHSCMVSLISQDWAVTAKRCITENREDMTVLLGGDKQGRRQVYGVLASVKQSNRPGLDKSQEADLALIKLSRSVQLSNKPEEVVALSSNTTDSSCLQLDCYQLKRTTWQMEVHTSDIPLAGTDAHINVNVYGRTSDGSDKNTGPIELDNQKNNFERGRVDKFVVETVDIGVPYKLRVWHDNWGGTPGWHLEKIVLNNYDTKKTYTFPCGRWLARDEEDGEIVRELPAHANDIAKPEKVLTYKLFVHTGTMALAGTNANVHVHLFGSQGSSGARWLRNSKNNKDPFEQGSIDEFDLEAVDLKKLQKLRVFHDNKRIAPGWFLEKIVVQVDGKEGTQTTTFPCNKWLAEDEGDGRISRDLKPEGSKDKGADTFLIGLPASPKVRKLDVYRSQIPLTSKPENVKKNHCMTDFGAALVCKNGTELMGVVASSTPGQYASIPKARSWIRSVTGV